VRIYISAKANKKKSLKYNTNKMQINTVIKEVRNKNSKKQNEKA